jgi:hypothetical protein
MARRRLEPGEWVSWVVLFPKIVSIPGTVLRRIKSFTIASVGRPVPAIIVGPAWFVM